MIKASALALAELCPTRKDKNGSLLPSLTEIRSISKSVARAVGLQAIKEGLSELDPGDLEKELVSNIWEPVYEPYEHQES
jgi:malate dehydrogenase (oxaloacetate-decarboxylating)